MARTAKFAPANGRKFKIVNTNEGKLPVKLYTVSEDGSEKLITSHKTEDLAKKNATKYNPNIPMI